mmetsp:Transcript_127877/g.285949  ORF Transcript_127877/g.285949 Transcript_127877/m.285949 type:complete len:251 (-) Transcript_127877:678-1430(-)
MQLRLRQLAASLLQRGLATGAVTLPLEQAPLQQLLVPPELEDHTTAIAATIITGTRLHPNKAAAAVANLPQHAAVRLALAQLLAELRALPEALLIPGLEATPEHKALLMLQTMLLLHAKAFCRKSPDRPFHIRELSLHRLLLQRHLPLPPLLTLSLISSTEPLPECLSVCIRTILCATALLLQELRLQLLDLISEALDFCSLELDPRHISPFASLRKVLAVPQTARHCEHTALLFRRLRQLRRNFARRFL